MDRALELARRGWGRVHPNPMVGAVVLAGDQIVGEGYHAEYGGPHAEAVALAAAGPRARDATMVVTLEPCAHAGKQPSCADAIIASGIRRVVIASLDPNPVAAGGRARLEQAGIDVATGLGREAAERLNSAFLNAVSGLDRPFVAVKLATSLDHCIADSAGVSRWISGEEARDWVHWFRAGFAAIGVGGRTAQVDDPSLTVRGALEPRTAPARVVFLGRRRLSLDSALVRTAGVRHTVLIGDGLVPNERNALTDRGVDIILTSDVAEGLSELKQLGIDSILIEGGGRLSGSLLARGLVDRFAWIVSPVWLGDHGIKAVRGFEVPSLLQAERWTIVERQALGQDTLLMFDRP